MPAPRKSADDTPVTESAPAAPAVDVANDTEVLLHDLQATQALVLKQEEMIQRLAEQVDHLSKTAMSDPPPPPEDAPSPEDFIPPIVPEGHKRYASRYAELTMIKTPGENLMLNGKAVHQKADYVDFTGGVFQTTEYSGPTPLPELIEWLETHPDFNATFWVDDYAVRRMSTVEVQTGVKSTVTTPRAPLVAPMQ
jgi:hypothetical protein